MQLRCTILLYTQTYNDKVSRSTYLQKLAVLPFLNVKRFVGGAMGWKKITLVFIFAQ